MKKLILVLSLLSSPSYAYCTCICANEENKPSCTKYGEELTVICPPRVCD